MIKKIDNETKKSFKREALILILTIFILLTVTSIISYDANDIIKIKRSSVVPVFNWMGKTGAFFANIFFQIYGKAAYLFILVLLAIPPFILFAPEKLKKRTKQILIGLFFLIWGISIFTSLIVNKIGPTGGGFMGGFFGKFLYRYTGLIGSYSGGFLLIILGVSKISGIFTIGKSFKGLVNQIKNVQHKKVNLSNLTSFISKKEIDDEIPALFVKEKYEEEIQQKIQNIETDSELTEENKKDSIEALRVEFENIKEKMHETHEHTEVPIEEQILPEDLVDRIDQKSDEIIDEIHEQSIDSDVQQNYIVDQSLIINKTPFIEDEYHEENIDELIHESEEINEIEEIEIEDHLVEETQFNHNDNDSHSIETEAQPVKSSKPVLYEKEEKSKRKSNPFKGYKVPSTEMLKAKEEDDLSNIHVEIDERKIKLEETLKQFNIEAKVINYLRGPVITRYEIEPAPGVKMSSIVRLSDNIAYSLAAKKVRIIAPIPGKQAVGVEIPNKVRSMVYMRELLDTKIFRKTKHNLPIALGKDVSGKPIITDLATMPHLLLAGCTGSGKSVCINSLICSLLFNKRPSELRFIMIDPKRVELKLYEDIPHLLTPVVTNPKKAAATLAWAVAEMERRYTLLESYKCRDIKTYNRKIEDFRKNNIVTDDTLHYIVVIIDEMADLMLNARKEVENSVIRLAQMSRAVGIHLVLATQSPRKDVITGLIKANFPAKGAFQVSDRMESRIILDTNGAEKLLGKGDMLFHQPGLEGGIAVRLQGAFVSEDEVLELTSYLRDNYETDYIDNIINENQDSVSGNISADDEPYFKEAVNIILNDKKASASYLQRRMKIGYNKAARMIEYMEQLGIVGEANGSKPREVLVDSYNID